MGNSDVLDLNDLRVFERVAALSGFSAAGRALSLPKSTVSRSVRRLEAELGTRLLQRNSRDVMLTEAGKLMLQRCQGIVGRIEDALRDVEALAAHPRGRLTVGAGVAFGANILGDLMPTFLRRYPDISVVLTLATAPDQLDADHLDVAIRIGTLPPSSAVARRLGRLSRHLCAAPSYLERRGAPRHPEDLREHDVIELPGHDGRVRPWRLARGADVFNLERRPRVEVNDVLTLHRLVLGGAGVGCLSGYLYGPDILAERLVGVLPGWSLDPLDVHVTFPSRRDLAPSVRAFIDFMVAETGGGHHWDDDPLAAAAVHLPAAKS